LAGVLRTGSGRKERSLPRAAVAAQRAPGSSRRPAGTPGGNSLRPQASRCADLHRIHRPDGREIRAL